MLFAARLNDVASIHVNYSQEIDELEQKLKLLREKKKQLENHAQQLQSAENAAESAIEQLKTAVMMVRAIDPTQVVVLKEAVNDVLESPLTPLAKGEKEEDTVPKLPSAPEQEQKKNESLSDGGEGDEQSTVEIQAEVVEPVGEDVPSEVVEDSASNDGFLSAKDLSDRYTRTQLKDALSILGGVTKGKKADLAKYLAEYKLTEERAGALIK